MFFILDSFVLLIFLQFQLLIFNLLGIEFHDFFMYDASDLMTRVTGLKNVKYFFVLILFSNFIV
jgi:hypothetical protein